MIELERVTSCCRTITGSNTIQIVEACKILRIFDLVMGNNWFMAQRQLYADCIQKIAKLVHVTVRFLTLAELHIIIPGVLILQIPYLSSVKSRV